ncbi:HU family DNA-binding protein [Fodinibius halophilus]|uniref:HU family DNA-binding protein n=1 Tax=Fodinibius halophilus TaxID=1736908 RepID=A0A6M1SUM9_9BACT|nr:HU family DNA-binding protein [Fodinibius halophilus]NGP87266.1 HU family DNA-binding protein [Fodinibius halophilus]
MYNEFIKAFSEVVREEVMRKNEVQVDGIGSFQFKHRKQFQKQYDNGRVVMMPPKDTITFEPENNQGI